MQQAMEDPCEDAHDGEEELEVEAGDEEDPEVEAGEEGGHGAEEGPEVEADEEDVHVDEVELGGPDQTPAPVLIERRRLYPLSRRSQA